MINALEVKTMNRHQRRAHQKNVEWINSLNKDKQELISKVVQDRAKEISREVERESLCVLMDQIGTSITGALVLLNDDVSMEYIENFLEVFDEFLTENVDFVKTEGKDWKMKLKEMEPEVLDLVEELLKDGVTKKELVKRVKNKFNNLTQGQIFNAYKMAKDSIAEKKKSESKEITTEDAVNYVFANEVVEEIVDEVRGSIEVIKEDKKMSKLKVVKKEIELKGEYGTYKIKDNVVNIEGKQFKSLEEIDKYEKEEIKAFARKMTELKETLQYI